MSWDEIDLEAFVTENLVPDIEVQETPENGWYTISEMAAKYGRAIGTIRSRMIYATQLGLVDAVETIRLDKRGRRQRVTAYRWRGHAPNSD